MYRHELKYIINGSAAYIIRSRLSHICSLDKNSGEDGNYRVSSLYFDDYCNSAVGDNLGGYMKRKKFRIRAYNVDDTIIKLERKSKNNQLCKKDSVFISKDEYERILGEDYSFMKDSDNPVIKDFYLMTQTRILRPKVIVDYFREAYIYQPGRVRITLDRLLKASLNGIDIFDDTLIYSPVTSQTETILEIKYTGFLPSHIMDMTQQSNGVRQAISKYKACRMMAL